ncbi:Beta 1,4 glucosyltransferase (plasmid) [Pseudovibrio sp. FO-BEG1]|uniref:glycosyltransferase family 2 protein n=1 Tax=Pseudovibrio sp. (strain FO-BEG1) TaxID=911045 RepID=UPI000238CF16|nr:glycosyltransferase family 2 protein [Pseudovibrio sp. FO-BEG1]AEV39834.1 Beta 1,4 glucosyltransferase [Pseudovibrio sp. FO-BEG1]
MSTKLPISAFIISQNEEDRILKAINSLKSWVDEVIVVDSGSTDKTVEVAENAGAKVIYNKWNGYGEQKRFAEDQCQNTWLLNIDADEEITPALAIEIKNLFQPVPQHDIFKVHIVDVFPHEKTAKPWAYGYWQYRLYNREKGRFSTSSVHDTVRPNEGAVTSKLKGKVDHRSQRSIQFAVEKLNRYSDMQVRDMISRGRQVSKFRLLSEFPISFLKSYILRRGFLYGLWGVVDAHNYAYSRFIRLAKFYQYQLIEKAKRSNK